jgi:hypothetical protein
MFARALKKPNIHRTLRTLAEQYKPISEHYAKARRDTINWYLKKLGNSLTYVIFALILALKKWRHHWVVRLFGLFNFSNVAFRPGHVAIM